MGANSGPLTQRDHIFYEGRHDITTFLRVHAIPGVMDLYDYSPEATGMSYHNDLNLSGVNVDGAPDAVSLGAIEWDMVTGAQGSLIVAHSVETDISAFAHTSYYSDDATPSVTQCTGDAFEYATSGLWIGQGIPNTDPNVGTYSILRATRVVYYETPGRTVADAGLRFDQATTSFALATTPLPEAPDCADALDNDGDTLVDLDDPDCTDENDPLEAPDADEDLVEDDHDNCVQVPNPSQEDADGDDYGNACDCDFDQSLRCNIDDFNIFLPDFASATDSGVGTDMNGDGTVGIDDFNLFLPGFVAGVPGPSGLVP
jgi:hypothetical protein